MELQYIEYFRAVAEAENMTKAAAELHVSQPTLSVSISKLEEELGVKLFDRIGNRIHLNPVGTCFLERTAPILRQLQSVTNELAELSGTYSKKIVVLSTYDHLFGSVLTEYIRDNPELQISQYLCRPDQAVRLLENGTADIALSAHNISSDQIIWEPIRTYRRVVLLSEDSLLAKEKSITADKLEDVPFILYSSTFEGQDVVEWTRKNLGFTPMVRSITNEFETMVDLVSADLGVSIVTEAEAIKIRGNVRKRLSYCVLQADNLVQRIGIAYHRDRFQSLATKKFKSYLAEHLFSEE